MANITEISITGKNIKKMIGGKAKVIGMNGVIKGKYEVRSSLTFQTENNFFTISNYEEALKRKGSHNDYFA